MDRQMAKQSTDGQNNVWTDQQMDGYAIVMHRHAKNNDFSIDFTIFTNALRTDQPTDGPTDRPTDGPTNGRTLLQRCDSRI